MVLSQTGKRRRLHERFRNPNGTPGQVFVVAHRGVFLNEYGIELAENSIPAIEKAKTIGCDMVEVDVRFTSDGTAIVMHDPDLNRTTAHDAVVANTRYDELKDINLVHPSTGVSLNAKIPTLEEAFNALGDQMMINVELKTGIDAVSEVSRIAKEAGVSDQVTVKCNSKDASDIERVAKILERVEDPVDFIPIVVDSRDGIEGFERACEILKPNCVECVVDYTPGCDSGYELLANRGMTMDGGPLFSSRAREIAAEQNLRLFVNTLFVNPLLPGNHQWNGGRSCELGRIAPDSVYGFWIAHGATVIQTDEASYLIDWLDKSGFREW